MTAGSAALICVDHRGSAKKAKKIEAAKVLEGVFVSGAGIGFDIGSTMFLTMQAKEREVYVNATYRDKRLALSF
mgnify:CR=1 FL=1